MDSPLAIFDYCQSIFIVVCLVITIPLACFVYFKLIFVRPFSENYTFKLIALNGIAELMNCIIYLVNAQLTNYTFMFDFYISIKVMGLVTPMAVLFSLTDGLSLHTRLFIALNRLKTLIFIQQLTKDTEFFLLSVSLSVSLALPAIADYCFFTKVMFFKYNITGSFALLPYTESSNHILRTTSNIIKIVVSLITLLVNMLLAILIARERRFNGEKGLIITSIVSYAFYMLYCANNLAARYLVTWFGFDWGFEALWCGYAQWLFLGLNSITPFWCLILFTTSVRRLVFNRGCDVKVTTIQSITQSH